MLSVKRVRSRHMQCPADSKRSDVGAGYKTLAENILQFNELGCMPIQKSLACSLQGLMAQELLFAFQFH